MKNIIFLLITISLYSCVPLKIAPQINDYKVVKGKRFQKQLPKLQTFIFNDPKESGEFYTFLEAKFQSKELEMEYYLPLTINNKDYNLSYYEVERNTKTLNLVPILVDASRSGNNKKPLMEDFYTTKRTGIWYIAITINSSSNTDCLNDNYKYKQEVVNYLQKLKNEYIMTHNYLQTQLKRG